MLKLVIPGEEFWDNEKEEFTYGKDVTLQLEHSLLSLSKWEAKYHKPFLDEKTKMTAEETIDYIRFMTISQNADPDIYKRIDDNLVKQIVEYIKDPHTATWFSKKADRGDKRIMTAELIYYQMIALNIPFECQKWHLNRLITLIKVCAEENKPQKKRKLNEVIAENAAVNAKRRAEIEQRKAAQMAKKG
jgi:hypothetical protein